MNILKILGIVVAVHVVAFFLMFVNPGCRSTSQGSAPVAGDATPAASPDAAQPNLGPPAAPADSSPAVSVNIPSPVSVRYSPTRPGSPAAAALESAPPADVTPATTYSVVSGDSLWKIAKKHGTTVAELTKTNKLTGNSKLSVGQKLIIPGKAPTAGAGAGSWSETGGAALYRVKPGDTLAVIARNAGTTSAELKRLNGLHSDYVRVGEELKLPTGTASGMNETMAPSAAPSLVAEPSAGSVKKSGGTYEVKPGETLGAIARKFHVKASDIAVANNIADPKKIRPGQQLVIPGGTGGVDTGLASPVATPATSPATDSSSVPSLAPATTTPPPADQDLDSGLKPQDNVPVIKVDDNGKSKSP